MESTRRIGKRPRSSMESQSQSRQPKRAVLCRPSHPTSSQTSAALSYEEGGRNFNADDKLNLRIGEITSGHWAGPVDPSSFLRRFLPEVPLNKVRPEFPTHGPVSITNQTDKQEIFETLVDMLSPFSPGLEFILVQSPRDTLWDGITLDASTSQISLRREAEDFVADPSQIEIPWVLKLEESEDPFSDLSEVLNSTTKYCRFPFERDGDKHCVTRGQIASCLSFTGFQFRLHTFAIIICGKWARFIRGDRAGILVTRRFAFAEEDHLVEFLWRYSHTSPGDPIRGHDPSLRPIGLGDCIATAEETIARIKIAEDNKNTHREFRVIMIPDRDTGQEYEFVISYPLKVTRRSPIGRATKAMLAFDRAKNKMVFVKDYWRSVDDGMLKEGDTYKTLVDAGVPYIPAFGKGNDVRNHVTLTDVVRTEECAFPTARMGSLRHYRMSLEEIGRPLNTFKSSHELVTAVADAMEAHEAAFHDAGVLHRDVSGNNILITEQGRGILIDWDLSLNMKGHKAKGKKTGRVGTPEFWSVSLLNDPNHVQGVLDDQESALYVLLWNLLRHTQHNKLASLRDQLRLFNVGTDSCGVSGEVCKELFLDSRHTNLCFDNRPRLNYLIMELAFTFSIRYARPIPPGLRKFLESSEEMKDDPTNYVLRERNVADRSWLVRTMRKYLEPRHEWPSDDKATEIFVDFSE